MLWPPLLSLQKEEERVSYRTCYNIFNTFISRFPRLLQMGGRLAWGVDYTGMAAEALTFILELLISLLL